MTDFPPPPGFTGYQSRDYDDVETEERYVRACTDEEVAILDADEKRDRAADRAEDEQLRDAWLALLKRITCRVPECHLSPIADVRPSVSLLLVGGGADGSFPRSKTFARLARVRG